MRITVCLLALAVMAILPMSCVASASSPSTPAVLSATPTHTARPASTPTKPATATATPQPTRTPTPSPSASPTATKAPTVATARPVKAITVNNIIVSGPDIEKVAITFDMGSGAGSTKHLLSTLKDNGIRATFFVTGDWVEANLSTLKDIVAGGHEIANHSYTHPDFTKLGKEAMLDELGRTEELVQYLAGVSTKPFFRPPFGAYDQNVLRVASEAGYRAVYWTLDSTDWREDSTTASVTARVQENTERGSIVVMHGAVQKTAEAMPAIITALKDKGLMLTTLSDLLAGS